MRFARIATEVALLLLMEILPMAAVKPAEPQAATNVVDYDIVYVRAPRFGDNTNTRWPEVFTPIRMEPGSDLVLLRPDGSEDVLFPAGNGAVVDPVVSFDAQWIYFPIFRICDRAR